MMEGTAAAQTTQARSDLRLSILDAALHQFVSAGYHGASMREIARLSRASKALLYYHFESKADLYFSLLIQNLQDLGDLAEDSRKAETTREQMRILLQGMLAWPLTKRSLITRARQDVAHLDPERREEFMQKFHRVFIFQIEEILRDGIRTGEIHDTDPLLAAQLFFGMAMAPMLPEELRSDTSSPLLDLVLQVFFDGLGAELATIEEDD